MILARTTGFFREITIASQYGASRQSDIAILMLTLPDLLTNILVGGALSVALIPEFKKLGVGSAAHTLFIRSIIGLLIAFSVIAFLLGLVPSSIIHVAAPGFTLEQVEKSTTLLKIVLWLIPLTVAGAATTAYLQANDRFTISSFSTFIFNIVVVLGLYYSLTYSNPLMFLAYIVIAAGFIRWIILSLDLPKHRFNLKEIISLKINNSLVIRYFQALMSGGLLLLLPFIARSLSSLSGEGSMSIINYSSKLVDFPLSMSVMVLSAGLFPLLSEVVHKDREKFHEMVISGARIIMAITISIAAPLFWFSGDFVRLVYGWGKMDTNDIQFIAMIYSIQILTLPIQGVISILNATFNAAKDTAFLLKIYLVSTLIFLCLGYFAVQSYGLPGLAISLLMTYFLILLLLLSFLGHRHNISLRGLLDFKYGASILVAIFLGLLLVHLIRYLELVFYINSLLAMLVGMTILLAIMVANNMHRTFMQLILKRS